MREGTPLRRRMVTAILCGTVLAVALFGVPLAYAVNLLFRNEAVTGLQRDAGWIAATIPDDAAPDSGVPLKLPADFSDELTVGVYTTAGARVAGAGPAVSRVSAASRDGRTHEAVQDEYLAVSAPVPSDSGIALVVRVAMPYQVIEDRVHRAWLIMAALGLAAVGVSAVLGVRQSARLAVPLERLTGAARALGGGDFSIRHTHSGLREADEAGQALEATARRLGDVVARERSFSSDVSHQLRTGLAGQLLGLDKALAQPGADLAPAVRTAIQRGEELQQVIDDLVRLNRGTPEEPLDLPAVMEEVRGTWHGPLAERGRRLSISIEPGLDPVTARPAAVRQVLSVLMDNAMRHGRGAVDVAVSSVGPGVAIDISDHGPGMPDTDDPFIRNGERGHGIGLALARSLAEAEGGRLVLKRAKPALFSLLLPGQRS
ncbi:ATP-binding protein [Nonomuraea sp. NPDC050536]|uniref:HAMP domain-containing sensor histidine kinase n=1 Tax=Nonomuraea sp. NPDC050536 TaxID=3364366 RepID=UPI0037C7E5CC